MKKIAFIIVRYGENINGGAEVHCQMLAERLLPYYEVEVLTTTIRAFNHPDQDYTEGVSSWNGVTIRRFKPQPIDQEQFRPFRKKYKTARRIRQYLKKLNLLRAASFLHPEWKSGIENERPFYESTATHAPGLLRYIESHKAEYAAFIFANFYTPQAVLGSVVAPEKSLLIPMAQAALLLHQRPDVHPGTAYRIQHRSRTAIVPQRFRTVPGPEQHRRLRYRNGPGGRVGRRKGKIRASG